MKKPRAFSGWLHKSPRLLFILGFACIYVCSLATSAPQAWAGALSGPGGNVSDPVVRQVDIARPAVVRILTTITGRLTVHFQPTSAVATFPLDGGTYPIVLSGSGAFVSSHGEILTADHVVNPPHDQELDEALYETAAQDVADYVNTHLQPTQPFSADDALSELESGDFSSTTLYGPTKSEVYLSTAYAGRINAARLENVPVSGHATVDRIEVQSAFEAMDVAIIHVSGMDDMPSIQLDDSAQVEEMDNLTVIGFPGNGDVSETPTNLLTSSINKIYVSALKTTDSGDPVMQVGGNVEHGDSGGPALDSTGNVVGIVSFGPSDPNAGGETTFLQVSNSAETLMQSQGVDTTPGPFERSWKQAMDDYSSSTPGHWRQAAQELQSLANNYTSFQGVMPFLTYAQNQASHEQIPAISISAGLNPILVVLLILLLLAIFGFVLFVITRRRVQPTPAVAGFAQYRPPVPGGYPPQSNTFGAYPSGPDYNSLASGLLQGGYPPNPANHAAAPRYGPMMADQVPQTPPLVASAAPQQPPINGSGLFMQPVQTPLASERNPAAQTTHNVYERDPLPPVWTPQTYTPEQAPGGLDQTLRPGLPERQEESAAPIRAFSVPRRPALPTADSFSSEQQTWMTPCGHINTLDVRFCRVCGQPVRSADSQEITKANWF